MTAFARPMGCKRGAGRRRLEVARARRTPVRYGERIAELPTPELVENRRRSIAMLPSGVPALSLVLGREVPDFIRTQDIVALQLLLPRALIWLQAIQWGCHDGRHYCPSYC